MKFSATHAIAGLAVIVGLYIIAKRQAASTGQAGPGQPGNVIQTPREWWSYAGNWAG